MYLHLQPDSTTAALNRHEHDEAQRDMAHDVALAEQKLKGIDPVAHYKADLLQCREDLDDLLADMLDSGALTDIAYLAHAERKDPANGEAAAQLVAILDKLAQVAAEQINENRGGLYDDTWMNPNMKYQQSLLNLTAYREELAR